MRRLQPGVGLLYSWIPGLDGNMSEQAKRQRRYHLLSSPSLQNLWDEEADHEAIGVLLDRGNIRDLATNPHTEIGEPNICIAPRFWLLFRKNLHGRVRIFLELDRSITSDKIKKHMPEIRQWQDFLDDWQGPEDYGGDRYLLSLHKRHRRGVTYADLAEHVAADALSWLQWLQSQELSDFKKALPEIDRWSDHERDYWASNCSAALQLFKLAGAKDEEKIRAWWLDAGRHLASKSKRPIKAELPVKRENIIDALRAFRKRVKLKDGVGKIS